MSKSSIHRKLVLGNSLELLRLLPDACVDLVATAPPPTRAVERFAGIARARRTSRATTATSAATPTGARCGWPRRYLLDLLDAIEGQTTALLGGARG